MVKLKNSIWNNMELPKLYSIKSIKQKKENVSENASVLGKKEVKR